MIIKSEYEDEVDAAVPKEENEWVLHEKNADFISIAVSNAVCY